MKLARLLDKEFHSALKKLNEQVLPLKAAFILRGVNRKVTEEVAKYEEIRKEALNHFGLKDENGKLKLDEHNNVQFETESRDKFVAQLNELINLDIELGSVEVDQLGNSIQMTVDELIALDGILK